MEFNVRTRRRIAQYLAYAHQAVDTGRLVIAHQDYIAAVNRAYYAIFYTANVCWRPKAWSEANIQASSPPFGSTSSRRAWWNQNSARSTARRWKNDTLVIMG